MLLSCQAFVCRPIVGLDTQLVTHLGCCGGEGWHSCRRICQATFGKGYATRRSTNPSQATAHVVLIDSVQCMQAEAGLDIGSSDLCGF